MKEKKVIIIGAGIVGLATAHQLLSIDPDLNITILEKENVICKHQSGNNSGVIHSGIYYKPGSLRASNCLRGHNMLLDFCKEHHLRYEICGKIIVASKDQQLNSLHTIYERGVANHLDGIKMMNLSEMKEIEPHVTGLKGIWVPQAGICDYKQIAETYKILIEKAGGKILLGQKVKNIVTQSNLVEVYTEETKYEADFLINCSGLYSDKLASFTHKNLGMQILPFRGEYYKIKEEKKYLVNNLIYPAPDPNFPWLGVHFTRMIDGALEAGPNAVLAFKREGYKKSDFNLQEFWETLSFPGFRKMAAKFWRQGLEEYKRSYFKSAFTKSLQTLIPEIQENDLVPGGAGVRALACETNGNLVDDFLILEEERVINVCNAPSPAATSSLSIGLSIAEMSLKKIRQI
ncbi:MAG: L-2-hydroxyglutarate oxidase [Saprospiraceae bacterium]